MIEIGLKYTSELTVTDAVTAIAVGSGDMPVLATPMMMASTMISMSVKSCKSSTMTEQGHYLC